MITVRRSDERGHANHGWLDTYHTFSFAGYFDPNHMGFRALRVINEDRVAPAQGFGTHPHRDMEIVSYVISGALAHKDSMGNGSTIEPGDVQRMTAGTGVTHSEFNGSKSEAVHFLQIWILPEERGLPPGYEQKRFEDAEKLGKLRLVASRDGAQGSVQIHQDARIYASIIGPGESVHATLSQDRHAWIQVIRGEVMLGETLLRRGDGAAVSEEQTLTITGKEDAEFLLFDLA